MASATQVIAQPAVTIVKSTNGQDANTAPGPVIAVGSTVNWTYLITAGSRDLTGITVTDDQGVTVTCPSATLAAGTSITCTASATAVAGQYSNIGTVDATVVGGGAVTASDPSHYFGQPAGLIALVKSTNGQDANAPPGPVIAIGDPVNWTYVVTNTDSTQTITSVTVTDDQGVTVTCPAATLAPSQSMTCTASGIAQAGQYSNVGTVTATHPVFGTIVASDPSHYFGQNANFDFGDAPDNYGTTFASNGARHSLSATVYLGACVDTELDGQPSPTATGDDTNVGSFSSGTCATPGADEDGVTFTAPLVVGQTGSITAVANAPCTLSAWIDFNGNGTFADASDNLFPTGASLTAGSNSLAFSIPATATPGATFARFRCTTDGVVGPTGGARDGEVEDYAVTVEPLADLSVSKSGVPATVTPGANITYTIVATNAGPNAAPATTLNDPLPAGTTFVSAATPAGWSCATPPPGASGSISCTNPSFPPGNATFTFVVATASGAVPGTTVSNTATISTSATDLNPVNNSSTTASTVGPAQADLAIAKTATPDPVAPGANLTDTLSVTNMGPSDASALTLSDALPAGTRFVSLSVPSGWTCATPPAGSAGTISCSTAVMPPGAATFTLTVMVASGENPGAVISNTAMISSSTTDPNPANDSSTAAVTVGSGQADLSVTKSASPASVMPGDTLTYSIGAANAGPSTAMNVALSDPLPGGTTFQSLTAPAGWTCTTPAVGSSGTVSCTAATMDPGSAAFTLVVTVTQTALSAITNTATVSSATADPNTTNNSGTAVTTNPTAIPILSPKWLAALLLALLAVGALMAKGGTS